MPYWEILSKSRVYRGKCDEMRQVEQEKTEVEECSVELSSYECIWLSEDKKSMIKRKKSVGDGREH